MSEMKRKRPSEDALDLDVGTDTPASVHKSLPDDAPETGRKGNFVPLKTTLETRAREKTGKVYVTGVPAKFANAVLTLVRKLVPDDGGIDFQHLRRFAKLKDIPSHVRETLAESLSAAELFLIAGPVSAIPSSDLLLALSSILGDSKLVEVDVPLLAPTSQEQAQAWTTKYWPTVYKKSNPFGPHPSIVERAEEDMRGEVESYMDLAERVAVGASDDGGGERVGVVVVERKEGKGRIVAVAGDARWISWDRGGAGSGNVVAHAVMRAIGMVAGGLKAREEIGAVPSQKDTDLEGTDAELDGLLPLVLDAGQKQIDATIEPEEKNRQSPGKPTLPAIIPGEELFPSKDDAETKPEIKESTEIFKDNPSSALEKQYYDPSGNENGYLCHELEIYCTHEPCVMCSMAIVHSRFGRVVFRRRMTETGGLCADGELGHGLFWRKELNWTLLGWQWLEDVEGDGKEEEEEDWCLHA